MPGPVKVTFLHFHPATESDRQVCPVPPVTNNRLTGVFERCTTMGCHVLVVTGEGQRTFTLNFLANIYADMPLSETVSEGIKRCAANQIRDIIMRVGGDLETIRQAVEDGLDLHDYKYSPFVEMVEMEKRLGQ